MEAERAGPAREFPPTITYQSGEDHVTYAIAGATVLVRPRAQMHNDAGGAFRHSVLAHLNLT
jgi:hypothetical protein